MKVWYGYVVLLLCAATKWLRALGTNNIIGYSIPAILADLQFSASGLTAVFATANLIAASLQPSIGRAIDARGTRATLPAAALALASCLVVLSLTPTTAGSGASAALSSSFLLVGFLGMRALGLAGLDTIANTAIAHWFVARRGAAASFATVTSLFLQQAVLAAVYEHSVADRGWRLTERLGSVLLVLLAVLAAAILRDTPEEMGLVADGPRGYEKVNLSEGDADLEELIDLQAATAQGGEAEIEKQVEDGEGEEEDEDGKEALKELEIEEQYSFTRAEAMKTASFWIVLSNVFVQGFLGSSSDFFMVQITTSNCDAAGLPVPDIAEHVSTSMAVTACLSSLIVGGVLVDRYNVERKLLIISADVTLGLAGMILAAQFSGGNNDPCHVDSLSNRCCSSVSHLL